MHAVESGAALQRRCRAALGCAAPGDRVGPASVRCAGMGGSAARFHRATTQLHNASMTDDPAARTRTSDANDTGPTTAESPVPRPRLWQRSFPVAGLLLGVLPAALALDRWEDPTEALVGSLDTLYVLAACGGAAGCFVAVRGLRQRLVLLLPGAAAASGGVWLALHYLEWLQRESVFKLEFVLIYLAGALPGLGLAHGLLALADRSRPGAKATDET